MDWTRQDLALAEAREAAYSMPLDDIDVTHWDLFRNDTLYPFFERLRREKPVHFHEHSKSGPFWSITSYDWVKAVDIDHRRFSSEPTIGMDSILREEDLPMFIAMDEPKHSGQRKVVQPVVAPPNLAALAASRLVEDAGEDSPTTASMWVRCKADLETMHGMAGAFAGMAQLELPTHCLALLGERAMPCEPLRCCGLPGDAQTREGSRPPQLWTLCRTRTS